VSDRYLAGREAWIQTAAKTMSLLQKRPNNRKDDPSLTTLVKSDLDAARSHLNELETRMDAYVLEASRARPDKPDHTTGKRPAPSRSCRRNVPDGSDDEGTDTYGLARPPAIPRALPCLATNIILTGNPVRSTASARTIIVQCRCSIGRFGLFMSLSCGTLPSKI
jgi:hypothetical protein